MEAIVFIGIQAVGKTTFYKERYFDTHVRISLDLLRTRIRERLLLEFCLATKQPFVVDNTNFSIEQRATFILPATAAGFRVIGYFFESSIAGALVRNRKREGKRRVPVPAILGARKRLEPPTFGEGFDDLYNVRITPDGSFVVDRYQISEPI